MAELRSSPLATQTLTVDGYVSLDGEKLVAVRLFVDPDTFAFLGELPSELRPPYRKIPRKPAGHAYHLRR